MLQAKQAAAAKTRQAANPSVAALADDEGDQLDPNQYFEMRVKALNATKASGKNPYPHKFEVGCSIPHYLTKWDGLQSGEQRLDEEDMESVAGAALTITRAPPLPPPPPLSPLSLLNTPPHLYLLPTVRLQSRYLEDVSVPAPRLPHPPCPHWLYCHQILVV